MTDALQALHAANNARFGDIAGASLTLGYGDFLGEVQAAQTGLGVLDLEACGVIMVRGEDAAVYLNGITTNDVKRLHPGQVQPNLLCANKGKILHTIEVARVKADQYLVISAPGELDGVASHLEAYHIREAVEIGRVALVRLDLLGPGGEAASSALGYSTADPFGTYNGAPLLTLDFPLGPLPRVLALVQADNAQAWVETLLRQVPAARLVGFEAYEEVRIQAGVPRFDRDYGRDHLPGEAALYDRMSFDKGCYVGQEVHARLHYRGRVNQKLVAVEIPAAAAGGTVPGAELFLDGDRVGVLTSLARLPDPGARRGIAMMRIKALADLPAVSFSPDGASEVRLLPLATDLGAARV